MCQRRGFDLIVSDVERSDREFVKQAAQFDARLRAQLGVEVGERLVEQEHTRVTGKRTGDGHALPFPAG